MPPLLHPTLQLIHIILLGQITFPENFPGGPLVKNLPYNARDTSSTPGQGTKILHASAPHRRSRATKKKK